MSSYFLHHCPLGIYPHFAALGMSGIRKVWWALLLRRVCFWPWESRLGQAASLAVRFPLPGLGSDLADWTEMPGQGSKQTRPECLRSFRRLASLLDGVVTLIHQWSCLSHHGFAGRYCDTLAISDSRHHPREWSPSWGKLPETVRNRFSMTLLYAVCRLNKMKWSHSTEAAAAAFSAAIYMWEGAAAKKKKKKLLNTGPQRGRAEK